MKIEENTFAGKWYSLSYILTQKLFGNKTWEFDEMKRIPSNTNLCTMMRSMFIWTPLYIFLIIALIGGYGYAFLLLPLTYGGAVGYYNIYVIPAIIIGVAVLAIWICSIVHTLFESEISMEEKRNLKAARHAAGNYTVMELIFKWLKARHEKLCPLIEIIQKGEDK